MAILGNLLSRADSFIDYVLNAEGYRGLKDTFKKGAKIGAHTIGSTAGVGAGIGVGMAEEALALGHGAIKVGGLGMKLLKGPHKSWFTNVKGRPQLRGAVQAKLIGGVLAAGAIGGAIQTMKPEPPVQTDYSPTGNLEVVMPYNATGSLGLAMYRNSRNKPSM